jgi:CRP-like cAMP-binding protein
VDREQVLFRLFGKYCPEGTILYGEGAPGEELYLVQSGAVRLGAGRGPGEAAATAGPGDVLGEEAFLARAPRAHRAEVVRDSRLVLVSDRTVDAVERHSPDAARRIFEHFGALAGRTRGELERWTLAHLVPRVAPLLRDAGAGLLRADDLADRSGLTPEQTQLVLERLAADGGLAAADGGFRLRDAAAVERALDALAAGGTTG